MEGKSQRQTLGSVGHISSTGRKQTLVSACVQLAFSSFVQFRTPAQGVALLTSKVALPASVTLIQKVLTNMFIQTCSFPPQFI